MKIPWPLFLAWKQLFPTQRKVSFFSLLAVVGVALGVNVMIVVVAFMKGFQHKFKEDIIDAQGHARAIPLSRSKDWSKLQKELLLFTTNQGSQKEINIQSQALKKTINFFKLC